MKGDNCKSQVKVWDATLMVINNYPKGWTEIRLFSIWSSRGVILKAIEHFLNGTKLKVHRFTNNLQGLQKVMVKDFSWNIIPWNALLFGKTLKQLSILDIENYGFILNTCHDTAKRAETRVGFPVIFSRLWWLIKPKFS